MRKILSLLLLVILFSGCIPSLEEAEVMVMEGAYKLKAELQKDLNINEYAMRVGDSVTIENKLVKMESFDSNYEVVFDVDGAKVMIKESSYPLIVNGLELTIMPPFTYDPMDDVENNYVKVKVMKFVPKEDHYLFYLDDERTILNHHIKLMNIDKEGTVVLRVDTVNEMRLMEDKTEGVLNLLISNAKPAYRAIASERYVILKVVESP